MTTPLSILGLAGSLRRQSLNRSLLRAAVGLAPEGMTIRTAEFRDLPLYDGDLDTDDARPASVTALKEQVAKADGVLIVTPEYNYGVPGGLKNAIDWISRPAYRSPFAGKDVAVMSAAPGLLGGVRAQGQLKSVLLGMAARPFSHPEVVVTQAAGKLEGDRITDDATREIVTKFLAAFGDALRRA